MEVVASTPRASRLVLLLGIPVAEADAEDVEYLLHEVLETLSRIDAKRGRLQAQIAAASRGRGKRRASSSSRRPPAAAAAPLDHAPNPPAVGGDDDDCTRKGAAGVVRRRLRAAAGDAKKETKRLEAAVGELEEARADATARLALRPTAGGETA
ncbi:hypothetical protein ACP4OV_001557 [Aristida adscensionis]